MKFSRFAATVAASTIAATSLVACSTESGSSVSGTNAPGEGNDTVTVKIGTTDADQQAWTAFEEKAEEEGIKLDIVRFSEYPPVNPALDEDQIEISKFQTINYQAQYNASAGKDLRIIGSGEINILGLYWKDHDSLDGIEGEEVAIPNDSTNQARAINVLVQAGLITLKDKDNLEPTPLDIDEKKSKVKVTPVDAAQTTSAHGEGTPAIINNSFLERAGIDPKTAIFQDDPNSEEAEPYINVFAVREEDADNEDIKKLAELWHSDAVQEGVDEDSAGTSVEVERSQEDLQKILDKLEADLD